jgi:prophage maintenance system killer protein
VKNPEFLDTETIFKLHSVSLHRFGGTEGVRDLGLIESALGSAQNTFYYGNGDLSVIAALTFLDLDGVNKTPSNIENLRRHDRHRGKTARQGRPRRNLPPRGGFASLSRRLPV